MEKKLNVCLLNDSFRPIVDGVVNVMHNYASVITDNYGAATVVTPTFPGARDDFPYDVVRYPSLNTKKRLGYRSGNPFSPKLIDTLAAKEFDVIHSHCPFASGYVARLLRQRIDVPLIFTYHTKFDYDIKRVLKTSPTRKLSINMVMSNIAACDEVWAVSRAAADNLRSLGYEGECIIMPNGVEYPRERFSPIHCSIVDKTHDLPPNVPVYLFVGRMQWYKGIRIILDALGKLKAAGRDFRMIFVGTGMEEKDIKAYCEGAGLGDKCLFAGVIRDRELLRAYFSRADLFLFPSSFDTSGLVVHEAAACGAASVVLKNSGPSEGVIDGENGLLIDENADSLYNALLTVGNDNECMRRLGKNAMDTLYLSWSDSVKAAVERYRIVLDNKRERLSMGYGSRRDSGYIVGAEKLLHSATAMKGFPKKAATAIKTTTQKTFKR